jgi:hypothetical protein
MPEATEPEKPQPSAALIRELKHALAMAESGAITDAVIVAQGARLYHRTYSVVKPEDMPAMVGEVALFLMEMQLIIMGNRQQAQLGKPGLVRAHG